MNILETIALIAAAAVSYLAFFYNYRVLYTIWGLFTTRKFGPAKKQHKYAILVAARNESTVIGNLLQSIRQQDYPGELVDVFVVADNCDDNTAEIARKHGAYCYERTDTEHRTKGFALQFLVENIRRDFGIDAYEGYFIFDADNLLKKDYITRMNEAFDAGEKVITSYRNTKNFDDNWISASYALHWLRTIRTEHRARSSFRLATRIQGTGFLFAWEVIKNGWNYTSLTEDRAFSADAVVGGYKISYNNAAEFYDEQPTSFRIAMRQRIRWAKGHLQALAETGGKLFSHIFVTKGAATRHDPVQPKTRLGKMLRNIHFRFMSYDMLLIVLPFSLISFFNNILQYILRSALILSSISYFSAEAAPTALSIAFKIFGVKIAAGSVGSAFLLFTLFTVTGVVMTCLGNVALGIYVFIAERKRIKPMKWYKKIWFCITFPLFDLIGKLSFAIALFSKVEWKPIPHNAAVSIDELDEAHKGQKE